MVIAVILIIAFLFFMSVAKSQDESEYKDGTQKKSYQKWKSGTKYKKQGIHESKIEGIFILIIVIICIIAAIINGI